MHIAVNTLSYLLALHDTLAEKQDLTQVKELVMRVQTVIGESVELAYVDQGYTGEQPAQDAAWQGIRPKS